MKASVGLSSVCDGLSAPAEYRKNALNGVQMAEQAHDPSQRAAMLGIAQAYVKLADHVEHAELIDHVDSQRQPNEGERDDGVEKTTTS
jgi:hypothetical protein